MPESKRQISLWPSTRSVVHVFQMCGTTNNSEWQTGVGWFLSPSQVEESQISFSPQGMQHLQCARAAQQPQSQPGTPFTARQPSHKHKIKLVFTTGYGRKHFFNHRPTFNFFLSSSEGSVAIRNVISLNFKGNNSKRATRSPCTCLSTCCFLVHVLSSYLIGTL